jgi:hypothetical protein
MEIQMKILVGLLCLISISAFAYEIECTDGNLLLPSSSSSGYESHFATVLVGDGRVQRKITNDVVLSINSTKQETGDIDIFMALGRFNYGWQPYASARGINFLQLNINSNSLSLPLSMSDLKNIQGGKNKRKEMFNQLVEEKESIKNEFIEKFGELATISCRVKK